MAEMMAVIGIGAQVIGAGATIAGGVMEAQAAREEGEAIASAEEANVETATINKQIANENRIRDVQTAEADAADQSRATRRNMASIRASFGSSGLEFSGSQLSVLEDVAKEASIDNLRIRQEGVARNREGVLQILGYDRDIEQSKSRAKYAREAGRRGQAAAGVNTVARLTRIF